MTPTSSPSPVVLPNVWHLFNLAESPFFQQTLKAGQDKYPISLFVGRQQDAERFLRTIAGSPDSSRQTVHGPVGVGKTTLVEYLKDRLIRAQPRVLSYPTPVLVQSTDTADKLALKVLSYVYDAVISNGDTTTRDLETVETARQLIRAFKVMGGGGGLSLGIPGGPSVGASASVSRTFVNPATVQPLDMVPRLLAELAVIVRDHIGAGSVLVHLNNLENLTAEVAERAAVVLRDLRDACFLVDGYHWLVVGTTEAIRQVISGVPQLRTAFSVPRALTPLGFEELVQLLAKRYEHFRLDPREPIREPVEREALRALYMLFAGDLRGTLRALEQAGIELLGYGRTDAAAPMTWSDMQPVLRQAYGEELAGALSATQAQYLSAIVERGIAEAQLAGIFTQRDVQRTLGLSQSSVSTLLSDLQRHGYIREVERAEAAAAVSQQLSKGKGRGRAAAAVGKSAVSKAKVGRPTTAYALTGATRLIYG